MLPEMAFSYGVGLIPAMGISVAHYLRTNRRINSTEAKLLQENLKLIGLQWSHLQANFANICDESMRKETQHLRKSVVYIGMFLTVTSWPGFLFHIMLYFSPGSRLEMRVLGSRLCVESLPKEVVLEIVQDLKSVI